MVTGPVDCLSLPLSSVCTSGAPYMRNPPYFSCHRWGRCAQTRRRESDECIRQRPSRTRGFDVGFRDGASEISGVDLFFWARHGSSTTLTSDATEVMRIGWQDGEAAPGDVAAAKRERRRRDAGSGIAGTTAQSLDGVGRDLPRCCLLRCGERERPGGFVSIAFGGRPPGSRHCGSSRPRPNRIPRSPSERTGYGPRRPADRRYSGCLWTVAWTAPPGTPIAGTPQRVAMHRETGLAITCYSRYRPRGLIVPRSSPFLVAEGARFRRTKEICGIARSSPDTTRPLRRDGASRGRGADAGL